MQQKDGKGVSALGDVKRGGGVRERKKETECVCVCVCGSSSSRVGGGGGGQAQRSRGTRPRAESGEDARRKVFEGLTSSRK